MDGTLELSAATGTDEVDTARLRLGEVVELLVLRVAEYPEILAPVVVLDPVDVVNVFASRKSSPDGRLHYKAMFQFVAVDACFDGDVSSLGCIPTARL
jgi:hypothetical protein